MDFYTWYYACDADGDSPMKIKPVQPVVPKQTGKVHPEKPIIPHPEGTGRYGLKHADGSPCDAKTPESCPLNKQKKQQ